MADQTIGGNNLLIQINKNNALLFSTNEKNLKIEKSIFFGGQKVLDNYCILISGIMENNEKTIDWEIKKKYKMSKIKNALISVSDKENLKIILKVLKNNKINIISSGGTFKTIKKLGFKCKRSF